MSASSLTGIVVISQAGAGPAEGPSWLWLGGPAVLVAAGLLLHYWGRRRRDGARARIGTRGGFGGPPGTHDVGTAEGFGVDGTEPGPRAGSGAALGGLLLAVAGMLLLVVAVAWRLVG